METCAKVYIINLNRTVATDGATWKGKRRAAISRR